MSKEWKSCQMYDSINISQKVYKANDIWASTKNKDLNYLEYILLNSWLLRGVAKFFRRIYIETFLCGRQKCKRVDFSKKIPSKLKKISVKSGVVTTKSPPRYAPVPACIQFRSKLYTLFLLVQCWSIFFESSSLS